MGDGSDDKSRTLDGILTSLDSISSELEVLRKKYSQQQTQLDFWRAYGGILSHDVLNDVNIIFGRAGMLEFMDKEQSAANVKLINSRADNLKEYIQEVNYFAEVMDKGDIKGEEVNLSHIANQITTKLKERYREHKADFKITENVTAYGDSTLLRLMMRNLLGNAYKYSQEKPTPTIEFGAEQQNGSIVCYVKDNGIGFEQSEASQLFELFKRSDNVAGISGSGVGLFIAKTIIGLHKGTIRAESEVGKGATFYFTLPSNPQS